MNRNFLKNMCLLLATALSVTSCSRTAGNIAESLRPAPAGYAPFPYEKAWEQKNALDLAFDCRLGKFEGQYIHADSTWNIDGFNAWKYYGGQTAMPVVPAPDGDGKIYTLYLIWDTHAAPPKPSYYGYTFTLTATDTGIIMDCRASRRQGDFSRYRPRR